MSAVNDAGSPPPPRRGVELVVKLGGAAITHKDSAVESLDEPALRSVAETIATAIEELRDAEGRAPKVIVVHGAGSFGHQHAKAYGVARGGAGALHELAPEDDVNRRLRLGFAKTRNAVCRLNSLVVSALVDAGVNAVGVSPFGAWSTRGGGKTLNVETSPFAMDLAIKTLDAGLVPVFHGDAVFDVDTDCAILSGDVIVRELCARFKPKRAVFVTDVPGIFDKPPPKPARARVVANEEGLPDTKKKRLSADDETKKLTLIREVRLDEKKKRGDRRKRRRGRFLARVAHRRGCHRDRRRRRRVRRRFDFIYVACHSIYVCRRRARRKRRGGRDRWHRRKDARGGERRAAGR